MPGPTPSFRSRPGGGFNQGLGDFGEHLDESAMQSAAQQKTLGQQQANPMTAQAAAQAAAQKQMRSQPLSQQKGGFGSQGMRDSLTGGAAGGKSGAKPGGAAGAKPGGMPKQPPPREVGSLAQELVVRPVHDILGELKNFFSLNTWLGISPPNPDDPKDIERKNKLHQRYQKLDQEQQQVAQKNYQEKMQRKKMEEEEIARKKQLDEQQKHQDLPMPQSTKKGPIGPAGSRKQRAVQKLQQDRKTLGGPSGSN